MSPCAWLLIPLLLALSPDDTRTEAREKNEEGVRLYERGEFAEALKAFRRARALDPKSKAIRTNLGRCILEIGSGQLREGETEEAVRTLDEAVKLLPRDGEAHYRLGVALYQEKSFREAVSRLEHATHLSPDHGPAHLWLGRCYYEMGYLDMAVTAVEESARLDPESAETKEFLERVRREAEVQKDFIRERSSHFSIESSGEVPRDVRDDVRHSLERGYLDAVSLLDYYPRAEIPAILYSEKEFRDVTGSDEWVGGVFDGKIRVPVKDYRRHRKALRRVVRHEVAHAIIRDGCGDVPTWFNEGLAQYLDGTDRDAADRVARQAGGRGEIPTLDGLEKGLRGRDRKEVVQAYALTLSFIHYLSRRRGESRFGHVVFRMRQGRSFSEAFRSAYLHDPETHRAKWAATFGQDGR